MPADEQVTRSEAAGHYKHELVESVYLGDGRYLHRLYRQETRPALRRLKTLHYSLLLLSILLTIGIGSAPGLILLGATLLMYSLVANNISTPYVKGRLLKEYEAVYPLGKVEVEVQRGTGDAAGAD